MRREEKNPTIGAAATCSLRCRAGHSGMPNHQHRPAKPHALFGICWIGVDWEEMIVSLTQCGLKHTSISFNPLRSDECQTRPQGVIYPVFDASKYYTSSFVVQALGGDVDDPLYVGVLLRMSNGFVRTNCIGILQMPFYFNY